MTMWDEVGDALETAFNETKAVSGSYAFARGGSTISITLWMGNTESTSVAGMSDIESHHVHWIIPVSQLVVNEVQKTPSRLDRITVAGVTYEILPIQDGMPSWSYSGVERNLFRVTTKQQS